MIGRQHRTELEHDLHPLRTSADLDQLIDRIGDARFVLLGEASHGTHEYYTWRSAITRRLITEKKFSFLAVEGDWPDCYRVNRFIKSFRDDGTEAVIVLKGFNRWPSWIWANWEIVALVNWLRNHNAGSGANKVGFYGLDVYSLWDSMNVMVDYLKKEDPEAAKFATRAVKCFEPFGEEGHRYARATLNMTADCQDQVVSLLMKIRARAQSYNHDPEASLNAEMNAQVIANAEKYYRSMVSFGGQSWNIRDRHMVDTLNALMNFHKNGKVIVWEHNTHIGDARYTDMKDDGLWNVGQLVREQHADEGVYIVGFAGYQGTVVAGRYWGADMEKMRVPAAMHGSFEHRLHEEAAQDRILFFNDPLSDKKYDRWTGHRAIGVVYNPEAERGNYVPSLMRSRYDALLFLDKTQALHPLHIQPDGDKMPETFPFGY
ncbi:MAG TPA: erythromycin esterase family protein [Chryseosolibacter sp.]|nr:erythromycin esterase family protein [Chryseosolibacter sp.]